ncbi:TPA: thioester-forming surface-anchored protein, partial [Streptococcus equi subsp. zooepidemicus]|nr:thioester-forming surface-anchored protein [Streptococcus equi subsp. zooepidemicus]HEL0199653.1 thioester-forming surface-anchored protein [Streptococcus equi subsp. zooepidemicus]HEL0295357.1 thioester-forming surface-anchored protein [Streptococcus equi subsp. zooepidemicus]HEL0405529.1 thioester-forming surface-anchored protein [Streptococcus equi subsp. zooepidemicus]HEL0407567.1 thioester-forming surface-anchored protein [Streptococcus equi subsp. zooepidemicus]
MRKTMKKMLAASTVCIIMSGSFIGGSARILAEQYYGYDDGTKPGENWPAFLYVTPTDHPKRNIDKNHCVYCFNRLDSYPETWEARFQTMDPKKLSIPLPTYEKKLGNNPLLKEYSQKHSDNLASKLLNILTNGYPYQKLGDLDEEQSRRVTQLAIWHFTDGYPKEHFKSGYSLTDYEDQQLKKLIDTAEKSEATSATYSLDLYITSSYTPDTHKHYQHLLGSTLIPKKPESGPKPPGGKNPKPLPGEDGQTKYPKGESGEAGPPEKPKLDPAPKPEPQP